MARLAPVLRHFFFDANGDPLSLGKVWTYQAGTSTPMSTYTSQDGLTPNSNPVQLDAAGSAAIWLADANYKFEVLDENDAVQFTEDNIAGEGGGEAVVIPWVSHPITAGQSATNLTLETMDITVYKAKVWNACVKRGTTIVSNFKVAIQNVNGVPRAVTSGAMSEEAHGVTFSASSLVANVTTLMAAVDAGSDGTVDLSVAELVPA